MHGILQDGSLNFTFQMRHVEMRVRVDGTYLLSRDGNVYPVELTRGYIVAKRSLQPTDFVPDGLFGRWTDQNMGTDLDGASTAPIVYWDAVEYIENESVAIDTARWRGELAIWDCASNSEIRV